MPEQPFEGTNVVRLQQRRRSPRRQATGDGAVLQFRTVNAEVVRHLERLLSAAEQGQLSGLCWVAIRPGRSGWFAETAGECANDLQRAARLAADWSLVLAGRAEAKTIGGRHAE
ncbi:hypothetical protein [Methylibium sp.]|uniref:hypothetical protein n=1 Tax=Methylibium sp. TaxID=2067992 RepID=UPI002DB86EF2|nr:hypothetical protein [Methylibium sp.]